jgi:hypothetical protein
VRPRYTSRQACKLARAVSICSRACYQLQLLCDFPLALEQRQRPRAEVALANPPLVVLLSQDRTYQLDGRRFIRADLRRLGFPFNLLFSHPSGLFNQSFCQCSAKEVAWESTSSSAASISLVSLGKRVPKPAVGLLHILGQVLSSPSSPTPNTLGRRRAFSSCRTSRSLRRRRGARRAHVTLIATEWEQVRTLDVGCAAALMKASKLLMDGRNALEPDLVLEAGLLYHRLGRG